MIESKLTPNEFGVKLRQLEIDSSEDILPVIHNSQIPDLPSNTTPGKWWIENFDYLRIPPNSVMIQGTFVMEHYRDGKLVTTTKTPIDYEQTKVQ